MKVFCVSLLLTMSLMMVGAGPAMSDWKSFHGGFCRVAHSTFEELRLEDGFYAAFTDAEDDPRRFTMCPLIRDVAFNETLSEVRVGLNKSVADASSCGLFAQREDGTGDIYSSTYLDTPSVTGYTELVWKDTDVLPGDDGAYALKCYLVKLDNLRFISMNETTSSGGND